MKKDRIFLIGAGLLAVFAITIISKVPRVSDDTTNPSVPHAQEPRVLATPSDIADWKTYTNEAYRITVQYPPGFAIEAHEGASTFEKRYLSLDIGTEEYIQKLKASNDNPGSGGSPLFVRITAAVPNIPMTSQKIKEFSNCQNDFHLAETVEVHSKTFSKCEGLTLGSFPSLSVAYTGDGVTRYIFESDSYSGSDKVVIEQILSTLQTK